MGNVYFIVAGPLHKYQLPKKHTITVTDVTPGTLLAPIIGNDKRLLPFQSLSLHSNSIESRIVCLSLRFFMGPGAMKRYPQHKWQDLDMFHQNQLCAVHVNAGIQNTNTWIEKRVRFLAATKQLWMNNSVRLCPSVTPFSIYSHHRIVMKF